MKLLVTLLVYVGSVASQLLAFNDYGHLDVPYLPPFLGEDIAPLNEAEKRNVDQLGNLRTRAAEGQANLHSPPGFHLERRKTAPSSQVKKGQKRRHSAPWGKRRKPYGPTPNTGRIRRYDFTVERATLNADGYVKQALAVNGQIPGPLIEADWGDVIEVTVRNEIKSSEEGTAFHWHGFFMKDTPWFDGVPGVVQCPIAPGSSFTYRFVAERPGTTWYHSHYSAQYDGGLFGPIVVYGPSHVRFDIDVGPVFISDYYHRDYFSLVRDVVGTDPSRWHPPSNNSLINGRNAAPRPCQGNEAGQPLQCGKEPGLSKFLFQSGKVHKLRLVNPGAMGTMKFSIDGHRLLVTALDFVPIQPYATDHVVLSVGQRMEVLVRASENPRDSYYMRAAQVGLPCGFSLSPFAKALILQEGAPEDSIPRHSRPHPMRGNEDLTCISVSHNFHEVVGLWSQIALTTIKQPLIGTGPLELRRIRKPDITRKLLITEPVNATGHQTIAVNGSVFHADYNHPLLRQVYKGDLDFQPQLNTYNLGHSKVVRVIVESETEGPHPMHLHGHDINVLAAGPGKWDGITLNEGNPLRRDVHVLPPGGHLVVQFESDNPGIWAFHCHIAWHLSMGFYLNFVTHPGKVGKLKSIPTIVAKTCRAWNKWSQTHIVAEIDDGV